MEKELPPISEADTLGRAAVRNSLEQIFALVESGDHRGLAAKMLYRGKDSTRLWKDILNFDDELEKYSAESTAEIIQIWLTDAQKNYGSYESEEMIGVGEWRTQEIVFMRSGSMDRKKFSFQELDGNHYLANID